MTIYSAVQSLLCYNWAFMNNPCCGAYFHCAHFRAEPCDDDKVECALQKWSSDDDKMLKEK